MNLHIRHFSLCETDVRRGVQSNVPQGVRQRFIAPFAVVEREVCLHTRHLPVGEPALYGSLQLRHAVHVKVLEHRCERLRHERQKGFYLPCLFRRHPQIHPDGILYVRSTGEEHRKLIDCECGSTESEMHGVQVRRHRCIQAHMQTIGIPAPLERGAYILCIKGEVHVLPTVCIGAQFRSSEGGGDGVLVVHEGDIIRLQPQSVHLQSVKGQREGGGVLFRSVRRGDEGPGEVGSAVRGDVEIDTCVLQHGLVHMQVPPVEELHHIHRGSEVACSHDRVILRAGFGVDDQQSVSAQPEAREGGEEGEVHLPYLMLARDELVRRLAGDRCQALRREDDITSDRSRDNDHQHDPQERPANDFQCTFHRSCYLFSVTVHLVSAGVHLVSVTRE